MGSVLPSEVVVLLTEYRRDRRRRVRERDEHLDRAAGVFEADPAEVGQPAFREVVLQLVPWLGLRVGPV